MIAMLFDLLAFLTKDAYAIEVLGAPVLSK